jgi:hypothetical protein
LENSSNTQTTKNPHTAGFLFLASASPSANLSFPSILFFGCADGLPLHVAGVVSATCAKRINVVYHVAWAGTARLAGAGAGMLLLELGFGLGATVLACHDWG